MQRVFFISHNAHNAIVVVIYCRWNNTGSDTKEVTGMKRYGRNAGRILIRQSSGSRVCDNRKSTFFSSLRIIVSSNRPAVECIYIVQSQEK